MLLIVDYEFLQKYAYETAQLLLRDIPYYVILKKLIMRCKNTNHIFWQE